MNRIVWISEILILFIVFTGCLETDIDYSFPYEEKPVALGFMDSVWGVRVWVGKTAEVIDLDSNRVTNPMVTLFDENAVIQSLPGNQNGLFFSSSFEPVNGKKYQIRAKSDQFPEELISEFVSLPDEVPIRSASFKKLNNGSAGIDLFIEIEDPDGFNAYGFYIQRFYKDTAMDADYQSDPVFIPFYSGLVNDREFDKTNYFFRRENVQLNKQINNRDITADSINITLFNYSRPMYDLFLSLNTPEPGSGDPFFEPTIINNSSKKGIIVFGSYSQSSYGIALH